ncbi:hypothetical protein [Hyphococcus lacteus]|uniref:Hedgehog/Intein (Hint) domain-containing protein n=1 Tax=Hyphococcus lacteus TaxID=3143536 RepID=A0ABV3Z1N2_9PROT
MKVIGNLDWRHPMVRLRIWVATPIQKLLAAAGRWKPARKTELECEQKDQVTAVGDRGPQMRLAYKAPRSEFIDDTNIDYTPAGIALKNGVCIARYSIRPPSTVEILKSRTVKAARTIPAGTIIEAETPYTYGDWVGDFVLALTTAKNITEPLILPKVLADKSYVIRDVEALGISYIVADEAIRIEKARIMQKRVPSYYWGEDHVAAFREKFRITPPAPIPGSILYLGRFDTHSEAAQRVYPSQEVARIVESLGGTVFDTRNASPAKFDELAPHMETIIADQGSALFGVMHSQTKNVIELTQDDWWHSANLFIANGSGVENYAVVHIFNKTEADLRARIERHLREFGVKP